MKKYKMTPPSPPSSASKEKMGKHQASVHSLAQARSLSPGSIKGPGVNPGGGSDQDKLQLKEMETKIRDILEREPEAVQKAALIIEKMLLQGSKNAR